MATLLQRRKWVEEPTRFAEDGTALDGRAGLFLEGDPPERVMFSERSLMERALGGTATLRDDDLTLTYENAAIRYHIVSREGDAWIGELVKGKAAKDKGGEG